MSSPSPGKKRMDSDVMRLIEKGHEVDILTGIHEFSVKFIGPKSTPYEGGVWKIRVDLPDRYPFKSPSIGFLNKIFHPNIDEASGTVCLDVINQTWTPMYELSNIFDAFLPQLLQYPNALDPLNGEAASLLVKKPDEFKKKVIQYVKKYAQPTNKVEMSSPLMSNYDDHDIPMQLQSNNNSNSMNGNRNNNNNMEMMEDDDHLNDESDDSGSSISDLSFPDPLQGMKL
ncbi:hypothetical protein SNEBB_004691 [Seison nebaliae]|nr:hypothetical protein SNEBB_004691 [Seison nebaliae]